MVWRSTFLGFQQVYVTASPGSNDTAWLTDASGNNTFYGTPGHSWFIGSGFLVDVTDFKSVYAAAAPGTGDIAELLGYGGTFVNKPHKSWLRSNGDLMVSLQFWQVHHA